MDEYIGIVNMSAGNFAPRGWALCNGQTTKIIPNGDRVGRPVFEGTSQHFAYFDKHATTQEVGADAGTAHANEDIEETLIVKEGLMQITIEGDSTIFLSYKISTYIFGFLYVLICMS